MTRVVLKGSPAVQWQLGAVMKAGGTTLNLSDEEIKIAEKNGLIESYLDEVVKEEPVVEEESEKELKDMTKDELEEFAKAKFNIDLDKRKNKKSLLEKIKELIKGNRGGEE